MRFMLIVKGTGDCEAGVKPNETFLGEMRKYNEALAQAGILIAVDRLRPGSEGTRVQLSGTKRTVVDGPFTETKEFIGGFWMWQVKSKEEAIEWVKRCPNPPGAEIEIEIRQVLEPDGFGPALTREVGEQGQGKRAQAAGKK